MSIRSASCSLFTIFIQRFVLCFAVFAFPSKAYCTPNTPGLFFPKNYVTHQNKSKTKKKATSPNTQKKSPQVLQKTEHESEQIQEQISIEPQERGTPIVALGGIFSLDDTDKLTVHLAQLKEVALAHDLLFNELILAGDVINFFQAKGAPRYVADMAFLVPALGGKIRYANSEITDYPISQSPTWIVSTEEGEILLEGMSNVTKFINSHGEFVVPTAADLNLQGINDVTVTNTGEKK